MMAWEIKHIFDGDYGCEELQPGEKAKVSVTLVNEKGETKVLSVEDQWLLDKNLSEGSISRTDSFYQVSCISIKVLSISRRIQCLFPAKN